MPSLRRLWPVYGALKNLRQLVVRQVFVVRWERVWEVIVVVAKGVIAVEVEETLCGVDFAERRIDDAERVSRGNERGGPSGEGGSEKERHDQSSHRRSSWATLCNDDKLRIWESARRNRVEEEKIKSREARVFKFDERDEGQGAVHACTQCGRRLELPRDREPNLTVLRSPRRLGKEKCRGALGRRGFLCIPYAF